MVIMGNAKSKITLILLVACLFFGISTASAQRVKRPHLLLQSPKLISRTGGEILDHVLAGESFGYEFRLLNLGLEAARGVVITVEAIHEGVKPLTGESPRNSKTFVLRTFPADDSQVFYYPDAGFAFEKPGNAVLRVAAYARDYRTRKIVSEISFEVKGPVIPQSQGAEAPKKVSALEKLRGLQEARAKLQEPEIRPAPEPAPVQPVTAVQVNRKPPCPTCSG